MIRESTLRQVRRAFGAEVRLETALTGSYVWTKIDSLALRNVLSAWETDSSGWPQLIGVVNLEGGGNEPSGFLLLWELVECGTTLGVYSSSLDVLETVRQYWPHVELPMLRARFQSNGRQLSNAVESRVEWQSN